jgi:hypothetical protein
MATMHLLIRAKYILITAHPLSLRYYAMSHLIIAQLRTAYLLLICARVKASPNADVWGLRRNRAKNLFSRTSYSGLGSLWKFTVMLVVASSVASHVSAETTTLPVTYSSPSAASYTDGLTTTNVTIPDMINFMLKALMVDTFAELNATSKTPGEFLGLNWL